MTFATGGFLGLFAVVIVLGLPATGFSCSCAKSSGSPCAAASAAAAVFVGTPIAVRADGQLHYRFAIEEPIRNAATGIVEITTNEDTAACGLPLDVGTKYLVYADAGAERGSYTIGYCSRTAPLEHARNDVELLRLQASGALRPRLFGSVVNWTELLLDGDHSRLDASDPLSPVRRLVVRASGPGGVHETRTDDNGHFVFDGIKPGRYEVTLQPPEVYELLFPGPTVATVGDCGGEACAILVRIPFRRPVEAR